MRCGETKMGSLKEQSWEPGDLVSGLPCLPTSDLGHLTSLDLSVSIKSNSVSPGDL